MPGAALALDAEFLFLLSLLRPVFAALASEHREQARLWLKRLCQVPALVDSARLDRNEYLCRLYQGMMANKLDAVFLDKPPEGALRPARDVFSDVDVTSWLEEAAEGSSDGVGGGGDADERTYLATQVLPGGRGAFGYLAVSLAQGGPHWVSSSQRSDSGRPSWKPQATSTPLMDPAVAPGQPPSLQTPGAAGRVEDLLGSRPPAEQRQQLMDLYDSLINDLDQAMREPEQSSPQVEKLMSSFQVGDPSTSAGSSFEVSRRNRELLSKLRERLEGRRERAAQRSQLLDSLELESSFVGPDFVVSEPLAHPAQRQVDEDGVWNIRPDNVALLEAAYPRQLVRRFLDAIVRERVAVLVRVRARRYRQQHVEGQEESAAEDMEHYKDSTEAWAASLRELGSGQAAADTAEQATRCADLATKTTDVIRELGEARQRYFEREEELQTAQDQLRVEIEMLKAEDAQMKRHLAQANNGSDL